MNTTRENIKEIAYKLFQEQGYSSVTINDICDAAHISKTTFYHHFNSKDELLEDFVNQPIPLTLDAVNIIFTMDSRWEQLWYLTYITISKIAKAGADIYKQIILINIYNHKETFDLLNKQSANVFVPIIKKAQETGEFKNTTPVDILIQMSWTMLIGSLVQWCINDGKFNLLEYDLLQLQTLYQVDEKYHFTLESFKEKYSL